jgi:hypothetical protein
MTEVACRQVPAAQGEPIVGPRASIASPIYSAFTAIVRKTNGLMQEQPETRKQSAGKENRTRVAARKEAPAE